MGNSRISFQLFNELIRASLGMSDKLSYTPSEREWDQLFKLASAHSMQGIMFVGLQRLGADADEGFAKIGMSEIQYLNWMGVAAEIQARHDQQAMVIAKLAKIYESKGLGILLLKGYGLSLYYPEPQMRDSVDVDLYLFHKKPSDGLAWRIGDKAVESLLNVKVRNDSEHHTKFVVDGISVENHYDFVNTRIRRSSRILERTFKALAEDHNNSIDVNGQQLCLPSSRLNALFLLRHCAGHFAAEGITFKNVLDWGMFVKGAHFVDWEWLWGMAEKYNMHKFLMCLNAICVEELGLDSELFDIRHYDAALKNRVLEEIMQGPDVIKGASVCLRTKRWWQHRWKHRICYSDSMLSSFIYSVKANIGL